MKPSKRARLYSATRASASGMATTVRARNRAASGVSTRTARPMLRLVHGRRPAVRAAATVKRGKSR
jgi:hypothetical protein